MGTIMDVAKGYPPKVLWNSYFNAGRYYKNDDGSEEYMPTVAPDKEIWDYMTSEMTPDELEYANNVLAKAPVSTATTKSWDYIPTWAELKKGAQKRPGANGGQSPCGKKTSPAEEYANAEAKGRKAQEKEFEDRKASEFGDVTGNYSHTNQILDRLNAIYSKTTKGEDYTPTEAELKKAEECTDEMLSDPPAEKDPPAGPEKPAMKSGLTIAVEVSGGLHAAGCCDDSPDTEKGKLVSDTHTAPEPQSTKGTKSKVTHPNEHPKPVAKSEDHIPTWEELRKAHIAKDGNMENSAGGSPQAVTPTANSGGMGDEEIKQKETDCGSADKFTAVNEPQNNAGKEDA